MGRERLALIDDDEAFCVALGRALERNGFEVGCAHTPQDALRLVKKLAPTYAVVDLRLGEFSGLPVVEKLCRHDPQMRIVVLTGYASIATAVEAIKLGAIQYLTKPTDPDDLIAAFAQREGDSAVMPAITPLPPRRLEWEYIQRVLHEHDYNISATARALGMHRRTLQRKLQKFPVRE
ncbi:DNA-binding response regulator [Thiohalobacter sp. COW1]|uniref:Putative two-component response regulator n=1 Tax=Thiohalobacter thiocyanaticus TaxID=585455 RepID=A0A1Z4VP95_9GAMM|nr:MULTISPECIES: response regulator transcription factor [Thiohalobacter]BAZ93242.1 putative two-component response regulator [Thiohalobacter thiocyanaticus]BCO31729.1 DNA-binding response regulator [Thiohalobacter sp. COW1]